jgi:hypothetical protein
VWLGEEEEARAHKQPHYREEENASRTTRALPFALLVFGRSSLHARSVFAGFLF